MLGTVDGVPTAKSSFKRHSQPHRDQPSFDHGTYDLSVEDESTLPPEAEGGLKPVINRLKQGILCHAFWSLCFDEDDEDDLATRKPKESSAESVLSLQGTALEEWQRQQRREKRAWLGLSFTVSDEAPLLVRKKQDTDAITTPTKNEVNSGENKAPDTIMVAKVTTVDKYIAADDPSYKVEDDVASEVSLDFPEPSQSIKGQLIKIKKKPPMTIKAKVKDQPKGKGRKVAKKETETKLKVDGKASDKQGKEDANLKVSQTAKTKSDKKQKNTSSGQKETESTSLEPTGAKSNPKKEEAKIGEKEKSRTASNSKMKASKNIDFSSDGKSKTVPSTKKTAKRVENTKVQIKRSVPKVSKASKVLYSSVRQKENYAQEMQKEIAKKESLDLQTEEQEEELSVHSNPRFIPDFSRRELKLRPASSPPEQLRWKYAEDSRWEYYGDPRRSRVEYWWKQESRDPRYEEQNVRPSPRSVEDRDSVLFETPLQYDSESENDSYFDRYASGPSLASPYIAKERAEQLARDCSKPEKASPFQLFASRRQDVPTKKNVPSDDLDDFAEVNDLRRPRRSRYDTLHDNNEKVQEPEEKISEEDEARDPSFFNKAGATPIAPGIFHL
jgi:hypothetical protein